MIRFIGILLVLIIAKNTICIGQSYWTLDKCINYAMDNNVKLKRQQLKTKIQKKEFQQSKLEILPSISAGATHSYSFRNSLNQNSYQYESNIQQGNENIQGSLTLFKGFQTLNTILRNKYNYMATIAEFENSKIDVVLDIISAYLQVVTIQ